MRLITRLNTDAYTLIPTVLLALGRDQPEGVRIAGFRLIFCWLNVEIGIELTFFV